MAKSDYKRSTGIALITFLAALPATATWAQTAPAPRIQDLIPDWANYVPATGPLTFSNAEGAVYLASCVAVLGANTRPTSLPTTSACWNNQTLLNRPTLMFDGNGRQIIRVSLRMSSGGVEEIVATRFAYSVTDTQVNQITNVGGGINASVRVAGTTRVLGSSSALTQNAAIAQALTNSDLGSLRGRVLPAITTTTGVVQSDVVTGVSTMLTRRTDTARFEDFLAGTELVNGVRTLVTAVIGAQGRCSGPSSFTVSCEGGIQISLPSGSLLTILVLDTALTTTTTINRTVTSTGLANVDIPIAAYGRAHPAAQTVGFDQSSQFTARMLRGGNAQASAVSGDDRIRVFLEGVAGDSVYRGAGTIARSDASFEGVRGGLAFAAQPNLTLGIEGESLRGRWTLADANLPETARSEAWRAGGFVAWRPGSWRVGAGGFGGRQNVNTTDSSSFGAGTSKANYEADIYGLGGEIGYAMPVRGMTLTPNIGTQWLGWETPAFTETGGLAPLSVAATSREQVRAHIGLNADYRTERMNLGAFARAIAISGDRQGQISARDGISQIGSFAVNGPTTSDTQLELGGQLAYAISPNITLAISGTLIAGEQSAHQAGQITLRAAF